MRTFLNHIKNETLDEIKTSLENFWQQMIQLSEFFQYSFVLILKRKCLVRASRVRSGESGTPSTIIYVRWSSRRYELGCDTPVVTRTRSRFTRSKTSLMSAPKNQPMDSTRTYHCTVLKYCGSTAHKPWKYAHQTKPRHMQLPFSNWSGNSMSFVFLPPQCESILASLATQRA